MHPAAKAFFTLGIYAAAFFVLFFPGNVLAQTHSGNISSNPVLSDSNIAPAASLQLADTANKHVKDSTEEHLSEKLIPQLEKSIARYPFSYLFIFLGCWVLLAVIRLVSPSYLKELFLSVFNLKLLLNIFKEGRFDWNINNFLLDVVFVLMFSIGLHQSIFSGSPSLFVWVLAFTAVGYFMKLILVQLLANIFFGRGEALVHLLMFTLFTRIAGLVLLLVLFAGLYQTVVPLPLLLLNVSYFFGFAYMAWLVRVYVKMKSISTGEMFYLFLYLCTIELSPIIILLKELIV